MTTPHNHLRGTAKARTREPKPPYLTIRKSQQQEFHRDHRGGGIIREIKTTISDMETQADVITRLNRKGACLKGIGTYACGCDKCRAVFKKFAQQFDKKLLDKLSKDV